MSLDLEEQEQLNSTKGTDSCSSLSTGDPLEEIPPVLREPVEEAAWPADLKRSKQLLFLPGPQGIPRKMTV